jgi:hypothetical protein
MFGTFMNRRDIDAACDAMTNETVRLYNEAAEIHHLRRLKGTQQAQASTEYEQLLDERDELIQSLYADRNALVKVIEQLVGLNDPKKRETINRIKSRAMDAEFERMRQAGVLKFDPRTDPQWRTAYGYYKK